MLIAIAIIVSFTLGGFTTILLHSLGNTSTQDVMQQLCLNCEEDKRRLLINVLQNDISWIDMDDDEIADKIMNRLYPFVPYQYREI